MATLTHLLKDIRACSLCEPHLPCGARPVLQAHRSAKILIAGQAPGRKVHESGIPFDDASGDRLRDWLGVSRQQFYDPKLFAITPMGFCYPGTGQSGDLPPRPECAATWRQQLLAQLPNIELSLVLGRYAQAYHLSPQQKNLTATVQAWQVYWPQQLPLPHPSPRNNLWLRRNPWFEAEVLPALKQRVKHLLQAGY
ncbi:uracil-DNA glycosylase family protein [Dasania sp. GY-MA-18]|uniref:Uracil-DNA glycosylase family protein n=1 Tax=Dasania phycosphaerae TaxID=2950436 RepID=A0A9J6RK98_9GAMM|nr:MULTISPECIES: uracil-DNA glycosylase family protein [Dasania]MCR8922349.1 uracil-DNA glycosylase family protein [Dasania sp. GY-MA-18]MCZ0864777.1 uracil-DNA glycosylase family protein [Dasania phycosphaerae]MCZ0868505.1 uracil-DNA glycosylase family protein [Dasania phycosphaerae]